MEVRNGGRTAEGAWGVEGGWEGEGKGFVLPHVVAGEGGEEGVKVEVECAEGGEGLLRGKGGLEIWVDGVEYGIVGDTVGSAREEGGGGGSRRHGWEAVVNGERGLFQGGLSKMKRIQKKKVETS